MSETFRASSVASFGEGPTEMVFNPVVPDDPPPGDPDFVVQIRDISGDSPCLDDGVRATVLDAITTSFGATFGAVDVDSVCAGGPDPANESAAFGVWLQSPQRPSDTLRQARRDVLAAKDIGRAANETIAFFLAPTLFAAAAAAEFPADPDSSTHLHRPMRLELRAPDTIITRIDGTDTDAFPDADFTVTIVDRFNGGPRDGPPAWFEETQSTDVDTLDTIVADIEAVLTTLAAFSHPWAVPLAAGAWYQAIEVNTAGSKPAHGVGLQLAAAAMPLTIAIPGGLKIPIQYVLREGHHDGVQVDASGMYVGGFMLAPVPRQPAVTLGGDRTVVIRPIDGVVDDVIEAFTTDMRRALRFAWTVNGRPFQADGPSLTLTFGKSTGPFTPQAVAVTVTDADGLTAQAAMIVTASLQQTQGHDKGSRNKIETA
jgi:hypothetical protein